MGLFLIGLLMAPGLAETPTEGVESVDGQVLEVERSHAGVTLSATVAYAEGEHERAAAAKAWHGVASSLLTEGQANEAVEAAQKGIDELAKPYAPIRVHDDTSLKIRAAQSQLEAGEVSDAASVLVEQLGIRLGLYEQRYEVSLGG